MSRTCPAASRCDRLLVCSSALRRLCYDQLRFMRLAQAFKAYAKVILTRKNTITGTMYSEDPSASPRYSGPAGCMHP
jgi:hypothetical protein